MVYSTYSVDEKTEEPSLKRLRPERRKGEISDYENRDDYTEISVNGVDSHLKTISKTMKIFHDHDHDGNDESFAVVDRKGFERSDSLEVT